jgi:hypothetical protein
LQTLDLVRIAKELAQKFISDECSHKEISGYFPELILRKFSFSEDTQKQLETLVKEFVSDLLPTVSSSKWPATRAVCSN